MLTPPPLPLIWETPATLRAWRRQQIGLIGFVPTMGNLHAGHASLIERARAENAIIVVSIFVNPLQFAPTEDFDRYPQTFEADLELCQTLGVDAIFLPTPQALGLAARAGGDVAKTAVIPPQSMTAVMCGRSRPGHFDGVTTIVTKLFNLVQPIGLTLVAKMRSSSQFCKRWCEISIFLLRSALVRSSGKHRDWPIVRAISI